MPKATTRASLRGFWMVVFLVPAWNATAADAPPTTPPQNVTQIQDAHDRALLRDLSTYIAKNPKAEDVDQAYMALFNKAIEHDWFADHEGLAKAYLAQRPDGPVRGLALIIASMARAQADDFAKALDRYRELMAEVGKPEQEEFAANFAESLATAATAAGHFDASRKVYETLLERYGESPKLRQDAEDALAKLNRVGKPAPAFEARDLKGAPVRLDSLRGKYVLIDFWATWCPPCIAELPRLQAAYQKYRDRGFEVVGVSLDETKSAVTDFVKVRAVPWRQVHNTSSGADLAEAFGVKSIPATFLIDPRGVVTRIDLRGPALDATLAKLFGGKAAAALKPANVVR